ncbi:MAG: type II toxin-antitoxin system RelE/ParE family toxin [Nanoarchaeota archaeon]|nr:type II toxin-antitoxin system RelE/ParE family toxin [Nanoarchaeota archaeon]MBU1269082.1 type II toxin-antitoxin system RelE/ParE family toxin [Nanoarchaeota archaeon]MBU1604735.1 type II toxin-antitoxin system RelE/ParE family toxin [Nanoarchaeota archaeon]MBU2442987.1 type II toxin-antitoxin system RelE/ParE family toxin [Nanoarchaeota archaeon]
MFSTKLHPKVIKFLDKCETQLAKRIRNKLKLVEANPFLYLEHYEGDDFYKLRIGDYRVLIDVDMSRKILFVRHLDHRKRIYNRT